MYVFGVPLYISWNDFVLQMQQQSSSSNGGNIGEQNWNNKMSPSGAGGSAGSSTATSDLEHMKLGLYTGNFTRNEVQLSLTLVHYWANFIKTG